jgi:UDP-glucuronate decarboxylase
MPQEFTIRELAELTVKLTNSNSKIVYRELPADDPKQRKPDITLAKKLLNWEPTTPLATGLQKTIEYFEELLKTDYDFCQG